MNALTTPGCAAVTMTSLELVEFINSQRGEGESELRHDNFMAKVPLVLGETVALSFKGYYKASNGKQNPMYTLPKREACLMAMSYSYDLQAKGFDRMTALEQQVQKPAIVKSPIMQMIIAQAQAFDAMEQEQQRQSTEIAKIRENVAVIEARTQPENKHFTVAGYATLMGHPVDLKTAANE